MKKKQTAVDYLVKELSAILDPLETTPMQDLLMVDAINKAKQIEEEQIMDTMCQQLQMEVNASETQKYYKSKEVQDLNNPTDVVDEYESMESNKILASNKDKDIFFNELLNPSEPNKALKDAAAKYKTKHKHGFTRDEYMKLLENYPDINMDRFWDALNGITCMSIDDENVVFHHDIELAIRCGMEDRSPTTMEWD